MYVWVIKFKIMGRFLLGNKIEFEKNFNLVLEKFIIEFLKKLIWKIVLKKEIKEK